MFLQYLLLPSAATIFAYGQTSSGKTFTMRGITENAVKDIYEHIKNVSQDYIILCYYACRIKHIVAGVNLHNLLLVRLNFSKKF